MEEHFFFSSLVGMGAGGACVPFSVSMLVLGHWARLDSSLCVI